MNREIIQYESIEASDYFSSTRFELSQFYPTEQNCLKFMINTFPFSPSILDIGCAAGGLGNALQSSFPNNAIRYCGVDINQNSISAGRSCFPTLDLYHEDFAIFLRDSSQSFSHIVSLSCIDWNISFDQSLEIILRYCTKNKVDFCFSFRSSTLGTNNIEESYQYVNYNGILEGEIAAYVVLSFDELRNIVNTFAPSYVYIDTFTGPPSSTAVTPYEKLVFGCMLLSYAPLPMYQPPSYFNSIPIFGSSSIFA